MEYIKREVANANIYLAKNDFSRADEFFDNVWDYVRENELDEERIKYVMNQHLIYNNRKIGRLNSILLDAEVSAGMGEHEMVNEIVEKCASTGKRMRQRRELSKAQADSMVSRIWTIKNTLYLVGIPLALADANYFHDKKDYENRDLTLELVREYSERISMNIEESIEDVLAGRKP